ncbi:hypothetical protein [Streptomyces griseofuscus]|uniref:hypothetical protein n=1 Tax=Streptomyces griseofuscus TaxID=146922 RepID=UPI001FD03457|nr:hypothetical protein [Streptomyces griseofuscus]
MAELAFTAGDLAQVRFVVSPMWQVVTSFRLLSNHTGHSGHASVSPAHRPLEDQRRESVAVETPARAATAAVVSPHRQRTALRPSDGAADGRPYGHR